MKIIFRLIRFQAKSNSRSLMSFSTTSICIRRPMAMDRRALSAFNFPTSSKRLGRKAGQVSHSRSHRDRTFGVRKAMTTLRSAFAMSPNTSPRFSRTSACRCSTPWPERELPCDQRNSSVSTQAHLTRFSVKSLSEPRNSARDFKKPKSPSAIKWNTRNYEGCASQKKNSRRFKLTSIG